MNFYGTNSHTIASEINNSIVTTDLDLLRTPESLAWHLIERALIKSIAEIVSNYSGEWQYLNNEERAIFVEQLLTNIPLNGEEVDIDLDLFKNPQNLVILSIAQFWMEEWLMALVRSPIDATAMSVRLPSYFSYNVYNELLDNAERDRPLRDFFGDISSSHSYVQELGWLRYKAWLDRQLDEPLFNENIGIRSLYIHAYGYYIDSPSKESSFELDPLDTSVIFYRTRYLEWTMDKWLENSQVSRIRALAGNTGSGKSTFAHWWADRVAKNGIFHVRYIPLEYFQFTGNLRADLNSFTEIDMYPQEIFDDAENLLLIFDGFDQLTHKELSISATANLFLEQLIFYLQGSYRNIKILITSRNDILSLVKVKLVEPEQIWHLLPYSMSTEEAEKYEALPPDLLSADRRNDWWNKYGNATGKSASKLPDRWRFTRQLESLISQPLINYLVAFGGNILEKRNDQQIGRNEIYRDVLERVYNNAWSMQDLETSTCDLLSDQSISLREFELILEEVSLCAWHGGGNLITKQQIIDYGCRSRKKVQRLLSFFSEELHYSADVRITKIAMNFYLRPSKYSLQNNLELLEFTHSSFTEFFIAKRLMRAIEEINRKYRDNSDEGWTHREALKHWAMICYTGKLNFDILEFWQQEIDIIYRINPSLVVDWQNTLCQLIDYFLTDGLPMEEFSDLTFHRMSQRAREAEISLLAALDVCTRCTHIVPSLDRHRENALSDWLAVLEIHHKSGDRSLVKHCLSWLYAPNHLLPDSSLEAGILTSNFPSSQFNPSIATFGELSWNTLTAYSTATASDLINYL
jgi:hypothetical protein